jgi:hypothetical protein
MNDCAPANMGARQVADPSPNINKVAANKLICLYEAQPAVNAIWRRFDWRVAAKFDRTALNDVWRPILLAPG